MILNKDNNMAGESGILPGITREAVIELAEALDIRVTERNVSLAGLERYEEAFLTNSIMEIMPLVEIRDSTGKAVTIGSGRPGEITKKLMAAYKSRLEKEIEAPQ